MPRYEALAHISWEPPFPLRLPPVGVFIWEPAEGSALFDPRPEVGELAWRRKSTLLAAEAVFPDLGPPNQCYPTNNYRVTCQLRSGQEVLTAELRGGPVGGFSEARPYAIANIFLCLCKRADYSSPDVLRRAAAALNNVIDAYSFITMDPLARPMRADQDCYYTIVSVGALPPDIHNAEPRAALQALNRVTFGSTLGVDRAHHIGLNSFDDLAAGQTLPNDSLELFHQLILSAIRRLKRGEHALAVLDAQSAFETMVAALLVECLTAAGRTSQQIDAAMGVGGQFHTLQRRLQELDRVSVAQAAPPAQPLRFLTSPEEVQWRAALYGLRNRIVHAGVREVPFPDAKAALVAGLQAIHRVQSLTPAFNRSLMWSGSALNLTHVQQTAGRLSRLFEA